MNDLKEHLKPFSVEENGVTFYKETLNGEPLIDSMVNWLESMEAINLYVRPELSDTFDPNVSMIIIYFETDDNVHIDTYFVIKGD